MFQILKGIVCYGGFPTVILFGVDWRTAPRLANTDFGDQSRSFAETRSDVVQTRMWPSAVVLLRSLLSAHTAHRIRIHKNGRKQIMRESELTRESEFAQPLAPVADGWYW